MSSSVVEVLVTGEIVLAVGALLMHGDVAQEKMRRTYPHDILL